MAPDFNDTLLFIRVAREGSFSGAARALGLPKTTVSRRIRELESHLGTMLLRRTTRRVSLTEAGSIYFAQCEPIERALRDAEAAVSELRGERRGWLRVTTSYSIMANLVSPLLAEFREQNPAVYIDLVLSHTPLDLVAHEIDVALRMGSLPSSSMAARRLAVFPNRVYASAKYLKKHGTPEHPRQLREHAALATRVARRNAGYAWPMSDGHRLQEYEINPVVIADDPDALKDALFAGQGLMMATDMIMSRHHAAGLVQPILPAWTGLKPALHAVFPQGQAQPPKVRAFVDFLVAQLKAKPSRTPGG
jgi:DNA-binding transcriptional LysR family regulator